MKISYIYLESLGKTEYCRKCGCNVIPVLVRYMEKGETKREKECTNCGKIYKEFENLPTKRNNKQIRNHNQSRRKN